MDSVGAVSPPPAASATIGTRVFQNTMVQLGGRVVGLVLSAATSILLVRYLGRERMGEYGAIYAYLALYTWLATFGLEQILAREASQRRGEASTGTIVALCFSVAGIALSFLLAPSFGYDGRLRILVLIAAADVLLLPAASLVGIVFQVDLRQWYAVGLGLLRQVLWLLAAALLVFGHKAFFWIIFSRTLVGIVTAAVTLLLCWRKGLLTRPWSFSWAEARKLVRYSFPLVFSAVSVGLFHRIDQVMLHKMSGDRVLGPYVVAVTLTELFSALPVALMSSLFPVLSQTTHDEEKFLHYLHTSYRFLMVIVFGACALMTPIALPVIQLFYGKEFLQTAGLLVVLIWSEVPIFFGVVLSNALIAKGLQSYLPLATAIGAISNILLNLAVIPRYGALGASWASVVSYSLGGIFVFLIWRKARVLVSQGLRAALAPFLLTLGITVVLGFMPWVFWWKLVFAAAAYAAGAWMTGSIRQSEIDRVLALLGKSFTHVRS
jgi:O-antigen/teichoic acid export membrane protein